MTEPRRVLCVLVAVVAVGCGGGSSESEPAPSRDAPAKVKKKRKAPARADTSAPTTRTVTLTDPVENAFTVKVPKGWDSVAYSSGEFDVHREVVSSSSPDGETVLFLGDPKIPNYWNPDQANPVTVEMAETLDYMELQAYTPADEYLPQYAEDKFGQLAGFEITGVEPNAKLARDLQKQFVAAGLPAPPADAADLYFTYEQDGKTMSGLLVGYTLDSGAFWQVDVNGLSTSREVEDYRPMLQAMARSKKTKPEYLERQNAEHARRMAQIQAGTEALTQQHEANMQAIQGSAERHQERMDAITAAGDANTAAFEDRMAAMDGNQRDFLNYVNDEQTVVDSSGTAFQVDDGYDRYFINTTDNSYVGGDVNFDEDTLLEMGLDPGDYEEVKPKR